MPSRKLLAATVTTLAAVLTAWATTGAWDTEETVGLIGVASAFCIGWLIPEAPAT